MSSSNEENTSKQKRKVYFSYKNSLNYLENYWSEVSESALFWKECISDSFEIEYAPNMTKNAPCTLNVIRKNNLNRFIFAHIDINSIRNKFNMLFLQVKGNADVIMISKRKLDDTFPVDQIVPEGYSKPFRIDRNKKWGWNLAHVREDIPARFISKEKASIKSFFKDLICARRIGL